LSEAAQLLLGGDGSSSGEHLLLNPSDDGLLGTITVEVDLGTVDKEENGGVATHSIIGGSSGILGSIDLS